MLACHFLPGPALQQKIACTLESKASQLSPFEAASLCLHVKSGALLETYIKASAGELSAEEQAFLERAKASLQ